MARAAKPKARPAPGPRPESAPSRALGAIKLLADAQLAAPGGLLLRSRINAGELTAQDLFRQYVRLLCRTLFLQIAQHRQLVQPDESLLAVTSSAATGTYLTLHSLCQHSALLRGFDTLPDIDGQQYPVGDDDARAFIEAAANIEPGLLTEHAPQMLGRIYESLLHVQATLDDRGMLALSMQTSGSATNERKTSGSYYTPDALINHLLASTLAPVIEERLASANPMASVLRIRVLDPSCGTGHFLLAAFRLLVDAMAGLGVQSRSQIAASVATQCIRGVDLNPAAVELCILALWLEAGTRSLSPGDLTRSIRRGNALLGVVPTTDVGLVPDAALVTRDGDDGATGAAVRARNKRERRGVEPRAAMEHSGLCDAWCAAFLQSLDAPSLPTAITTGTLTAIDQGLPLAAETQAKIATIRTAHELFHWHEEFPDLWGARDGSRGFDVIIGNPPFLNQLETATATSRRAESLARAVSGGTLRGYTDLSAAFLLRATQLAAPNGRICLVQPQSLLAARDAKPIRDAVLAHASLESLWVSNAHIFKGTSVFTCAPTLRMDAPRQLPLARSTGTDFRHLPPITIDCNELVTSETWAHLAAAASGFPEIHLPAGPTLAQLATTTADFRDQYYGLHGFIIEDSALDGPADEIAFPKLITSGLVDLAHNLWGHVPTRILKQSWSAPRVDRHRMQREGELGPWLTQRLVPKLLLATQTRVLEVIVDAPGLLVPSIPLISVIPKQADDLWRLAAAVASPVATLIAMQRYAGTALCADAIKLSASQVLGLPLPTNEERWSAGTECFRAACAEESPVARSGLLDVFGAKICDAYGLTVDQAAMTVAWWCQRRVRCGGRPARA